MDYMETCELLATIKQAETYFADSKITSENSRQLMQDIVDAIKAINLTLFDSQVITNYNFEKFLSEDIPIETFRCEVNSWCSFIDDIITNRKSQANDIDEKFVRLTDYAKYVDADIIFENIKTNLLNLNSNTIAQLAFHYHTFKHMWGDLDISNNVYDVIHDRVSQLKEHLEDFIWLYNRLGDYRSKLVLTNTLYNWITFEYEYLNSMCENNYRDYYDLDLLQCDENDVVVDIGAYIGDSALDYIHTYRKYKKIYCYEITPDTVTALKKNLSPYENVEILNKGCGSKAGKMYLQNDIGAESNTLSDSGNGAEIEVVTLDEDIKEKITLIKMDIEGAEQDALKGCVRHITQEHPKLLICVYHNNRDIWEIPRMITDWHDDYKLYLRSNNRFQVSPTQLVLFAL